MTHGLPVSAIAQRVRLDRKTVRRFADLKLPPTSSAPVVVGLPPSTAYLPYLARRWREGQHVAAFLFDEVRQQGYRGSKRTFRGQQIGRASGRERVEIA